MSKKQIWKQRLRNSTICAINTSIVLLIMHSQIFLIFYLKKIKDISGSVSWHTKQWHVPILFTRSYVSVKQLQLESFYWRNFKLQLLASHLLIIIVITFHTILTNLELWCKYHVKSTIHESPRNRAHGFHKIKSFL